MDEGKRVLAINTGSSSVKTAVFEQRAGALQRVLSLTVERIGVGGAGGKRAATDESGETTTEEAETSDFPAALGWVYDQLETRGLLAGIVAAGHRVVHGGPRHIEPERVSPELIEDLRGLIPIDPEHLPQAIAAIEATTERAPDLPQVACFDTAFHNRMPRVAKQLPLPRRFEAAGVRRYGFHGLSYESIMEQLRRIAPAEVEGKIVIAHLGAGASMAAVERGVGIDTTMGFTPTGGLMMATRPGDLDPGVFLYLLQVAEMPADEINHLLNKESGLLGVSETSGDMRDLLEIELIDERAAEAAALFCHLARKKLGALAASLDGLDEIIFTGGIGQHSVPVRRRICERLGFMGIRLDLDANARGDAIISASDSRVIIRVMATDEERAVAIGTTRVLGAIDVSL
jgi:acetate kinase